jgi:hypothetical protein
MSISNDNVDIIVNPEKVTIELQDDIQSIFVNAESITVQVNDLLSINGDASFVIGETPSGAINGQNATFTSLQNFVPLSVDVILNSTVQTYGIDYITTGTNTITLNVAPVVGDILRLNYKIG